MDKHSSKTSNQTDSNSSPLDGTPIDQLSVVVAQRIAEESAALVEQLERLLGGATRLTTEERTRSSGKLHEGEATIFGEILTTVEANPGYFAVGQTRNGVLLDPPHLRDQIAARELLITLSSRLGSIVTRVDDTVLHLGGVVRGPVMSAYRLARVVAENDPRVRTLLAPAVDYYARVGRKGKATRQKNREAQATPATPAKDNG